MKFFIILFAYNLIIEYSKKNIENYRRECFWWNEKEPRVKIWPWVSANPGLEIATDMVANATNIFSLATKNSGLVTKVATRFLYILDLN